MWCRDLNISLLKWIAIENSIVFVVSAANKCLSRKWIVNSYQKNTEINQNMLLRYFKTTLKGNLVSNQICGFPCVGKFHSRLLSTSTLSRNQYDDLYADRWATFQCKLFNSSAESFPVVFSIKTYRKLLQSHSHFQNSRSHNFANYSLFWFSLAREITYISTTKHWFLWSAAFARSLVSLIAVNSKKMKIH